MKNYRSVFEDYEQKYSLFFEEQAGILAAGLETGRPCPVCGSTEHPHPRQLSLHAVSEQEVESAKKMRDKAEKVRDQAADLYREKWNAFESSRSVFWDNCRKLLGEDEFPETDVVVSGGSGKNVKRETGRSPGRTKETGTECRAE